MLFENVLYHISQSLPEETQTEISRILDHNGATPVDLKNATHVISNTIEFEGCDKLASNVACVTPYWVERSMELGQLQDAAYFSADKAMFFSGVIATSADLPQGDCEVFASSIRDRGGQWKDALTRDVTHLIVTNVNSEKYDVAMHWRDIIHITIVLPQWLDQCWDMQMLIPPTIFQFPDPPFLKHEHDISWYKAQLFPKKNDDYLGDGFNKKAMFHTLAREPSFRERSPRDIWKGRKVLFSASLELHNDRKKALEERVRTAGGGVASSTPDTEETAVDDADVLVTRYRYGPAYARALAKGKTIGTLAWFLYVDKTGIISRPRDQLLHYPVRPEPIPGFEHHEITVTNYQGDARDYIKKLIQLMGATFTPTMSGKNTVVIAAYKSGIKTDKAAEWSLPIVHHKWLEDCFVEWRNLTPAVKKYVDFRPGFNYGTLLGERGVGHFGLLEADKAKEAKEAKAAVVKDATTSVSPSKPSETPQPDGRPFLNTANSALEVEQVLNVPDAPAKFGPPRSAKSPLKGKVLDDKRPITSSANAIKSPKKPTKSSVDERKEEEEEEKEEEEENMTKVQQKRVIAKGKGPLSKSKPKLKPPSEPKDVDSDDSIQEIPLPSKKIGLSKNAQGFSTESPKKRDRNDARNDIKKGSSSKSKDVERSEDSSTSSIAVKLTGSGNAKRPPPSLSNGTSDDEIVEVKRPKVVKTYKSPLKKVKMSTLVASSSEDSDSAVREKSAVAQKTLRPSSNKTIAVELPEPRSLLKSIAKKPTAKKTPIPKDDSDESVVSITRQSTLSRRSAAVAANHKLRTEIMPDVMNFQNERKKSTAQTRRRKSSLGTAMNVGDGNDSGDSIRVVKKARVSVGDDESEDTPGQLVTHISDTKRPASGGSTRSVNEKKVHSARPVSKADDTKRSDGSSLMDPKKIRILTTKIEVPDSITEVLTKLGVKFTVKPNECTHLIAGGMNRTEKFLCALPQAPYVLNTDWLTACANEKRIVAEEPFTLEDPDVEDKHKFKLSEALQRARDLKKKKTKLLQGRVFYITPNVKVDHDMLISILKANGAEGKRTTPNLRNLSDTKHVLSCLKDEHLWRTLERSGIPIYSQELVLSGALKQVMDWDSPEMKVQAETA